MSWRAVAVMAGCLAGATLVAGILRHGMGVPNTSAVYLLAVVAAGTISGTWAAVATSVASFLAYDFLFVAPFYTLTVGEPEAWLNLLLFFVVAIVIGRLSALQLERTQEAERRAAEARAMFAISRDLATVATALEAAPLVTSRLAREAEMSRVWLGLGPSPGEERVVADTQPGTPRPTAGLRWVLRASVSEAQPGWVRVHDASPARRPDREGNGTDLFRVPIEAAGETVGSLWATRERSPQPGRSHTRLMAAAADQLGQAVRRDRLAAEATAAEVARGSDALKSALLDSVSHDLRTPLAAIRAAAGNLIDQGQSLTPEEGRELARSIDGEAERLNRLVRNVLDLSRIEAGALRPSVALYELGDLLESVVDRLAPLLAGSRLALEIPADLPPLSVDALYLDQIVSNLLENAVRYAPGQEIRVTARRDDGDAWVDLTVEDSGPGVPEESMDAIFGKFYRLSRRGSDRTGARAGMGVGLSVVRGLAEAMGGSVEAHASELGGLAITVRLMAGAMPSARSDGPARDAPAGGMPPVDAPPFEASTVDAPGAGSMRVERPSESAASSAHDG